MFNVASIVAALAPHMCIDNLPGINAWRHVSSAQVSAAPLWWPTAVTLPTDQVAAVEWAVLSVPVIDPSAPMSVDARWGPLTGGPTAINDWGGTAAQACTCGGLRWPDMPEAASQDAAFQDSRPSHRIQDSRGITWKQQQHHLRIRSIPASPAFTARSILVEL